MEILVSRNVNSFQAPKKSLGSLNASVIARLISAAADVALVVDKSGIVKDIAVGSEDLANAGFGEWIGVPWVDTVTPESRHKVEELLREAALKVPTRWREVNHTAPGGDLVPVRYSALQIRSDGRIVAFGRDLRALASLQQQLVDAQLSIERDYARLRQSELRYRLLFQIASEAIVIADAWSGRITEVNPAAQTLIGESSKKLTAQTLVDLVDPADAAALHDLLATVRSTGAGDSVVLRLAGLDRRFTFSSSFFRQGASAFILARIAPVDPQVCECMPGKTGMLDRILERLPEGFVTTDADGRVLSANTAFLDLAQLSNPEQAQGHALENWLGRSGVDMNVLMANLREHGSVRGFPTIVNGAYGSLEDVEVSAVSVPNGQQPGFGFVIRSSATRASQQKAARPANLARSVDQLTELVGRVSLKDLVRESSDLIEKLCIEAALELTGDNRASAAEMLGLSRQSLYVKLRRYGLGDLQPEGSGE
ncbi:transcriptional regulator PpsR [Rhodomicrobium lacus]|uniref:transcriptional regulator PpsR n=1 Tax=Rhodomicrobium lacus TaxID=2498452 RepID=UPI000F8CC855|nr:transcriptional regulator PpsR [Rhodomicrobium lacus]